MFLAVAVLLFIATINFSCGNKDKVKTTTYQIINNMTLVPNSVDKYLDYSIYEVWVDCYVGTSIVKTDKFDKIAASGGKSPVTEVDADKIKISCKILPPASPNYSMPENARIYISGFFTIVENTDNVIKIEYETPVDKKGSSTFGDAIKIIVKK